MILKQGTTLERGKYRIDGVLGQGGFGITYLGEQIYLGRKVAIKEFFMDGICVRDDATQAVTAPADTNRGLVERFRRKFIKEAQNIARLKHRGIVPIIDIFEENGTAYYVMEHLPGGSLAGKVKQGALPEREALRYIGQVAAALEYVHSQRIMHLDVKPANILLDEDDNAVLIDFGLAKQYDSTGHQTSTTPVGISHGYAPLEQYKQGGVEQFIPATDVYSLGATLYKLVTGNTPPEASDVINQGLPAFPPSVSPAVQKAIIAAMQPAVKARPQSVGEFMRLVESGKIKVESEKSTVISSDSEKSARLDNGNASGGSPFATEEILPPYGRRNDEPANRVISSDSEKSQKNSALGNKLMGIVAVAATILFTAVLFFGVKSCIEADRESVDYVDETERQQPIANPPVSEQQHVRTFTVKGVSFKMIEVEGGTFQMGATAEQQSNQDDEKPVHTVTLDSYYIGETEVTQELWRAVMGSNPSLYSGDDLLPVENVSWYDCQNFIKELNKLTGKNFRLPTEAEWEFAARGGNSSSGYCYSGSSNIGDVAWYGLIGVYKTHPVKGKNPNELGIYDMSGNVFEWCSDWYSRSYYNSSPQNNPEGPSSGFCRVLRGGSWNSNDGYCCVAVRYYNRPDYSIYHYGLRLALITEQQIHEAERAVDGQKHSDAECDSMETDNTERKYKEPERVAKIDTDVRDLKGEEHKRKKKTQLCGIINGHEYVDLGLSVKWATCNVGANAPHEYGDYYAWGETLHKENYTEENSATYGKMYNDIGGDARFDVASDKWGSSWHLPNKTQYRELVDNCVWTWTAQNGINGYEVTSKKNGNSIFLPAAGCRKGGSLESQGEYGHYWIAASYDYGTDDVAYCDPKMAYDLDFCVDRKGVNWGYRYYGQSVRPVCD